MANIVSIGTAVPAYCHRQQDILQFMQLNFGLQAAEARKLGFLYHQSGIETRYSVLDCFSPPFTRQPFGNEYTAIAPLSERMTWYLQHAAPLSMQAVQACIHGHTTPQAITHLITVSCTGMSAPGLDLELVHLLGLAPQVFRTSVNFMGCYAAIHALKLAHLICTGQPNAQVLVVATELCTLHFQPNYTVDNATSSLLFADGSAAILLSNTLPNPTGFALKSFYSQVLPKGSSHMSWHLGNEGFLMQLSSYVPQLIEADVEALVTAATAQVGLQPAHITHWCLHPGGRKILDSIAQKLQLSPAQLLAARQVLRQYGNMSSASILFVLQQLLQQGPASPQPARMLGMAFGPGLTMETFYADNI